MVINKIYSNLFDKNIDETKVAGKLEKKAVLKAICAGFEENTEPPACLSDGEVH